MVEGIERIEGIEGDLSQGDGAVGSAIGATDWPDPQLSRETDLYMRLADGGVDSWGLGPPPDVDFLG